MLITFLTGISNCAGVSEEELEEEEEVQMASARKLLKAAGKAELHTLAELDTEDQVQLCRWAVKTVERCGVACSGGFAIIPYISLVPPVSFPALVSRSLQHTIDAAASGTKVKETLQQ